MHISIPLDAIYAKIPVPLDAHPKKQEQNQEVMDLYKKPRRESRRRLLPMLLQLSVLSRFTRCSPCIQMRHRIGCGIPTSRSPIACTS